MKLVTYYTSTHEILFRDFLNPSIPEGFNVLKMKGDQISEDGSYFSHGFGETTRKKMEFLLSELENSEDEEIVLFSDVDIIFISDPSEYLMSYSRFDAVFQNNYDGLNTGFFLLKNKEEVRNMLRDVLENCHKYQDDQIALNDIIKNHSLKIGVFDDRILSPGALNKGKCWSGEALDIPNETLVFHACWCVGVENKISLLKYVRNYKKR